ncbi:MAG TPA: trypsin-like peptidase domain-containing protein [Candidatus Polarisedimenticolia bacterium]|nr:trypsin-like peptidase domain-containing protein [Candidatus Polarisedimenticolia bacterium]
MRRTGVALLMVVSLLAGFLFAQAVQRPPDEPPVRGEGSTSMTERAAETVPAAERPARREGARTALLDGDLTADESRNIEIFRRASAAVANITSLQLRRDFFSLDVLEIPRGTGSGFVWDGEGHVVTNFHVIEGGRRFTVTLADQTDYEAEVVGYAAEKDLAVLRIEAPSARLSPLPLGSSRDLAVGQTVLALGNPFGLDHSLTVGVVSAVGRELRSPSGRTIRDVIQTDAAINPGNSGGPLLDSSGRLVGVNSAIYSPSGAFAGIGFAVPVDTVKRLVPQLIEHGKAIQPGIGASLLRESMAQRLGLEGIIIGEVSPGGPAARAGLEGVRQSRSGRWAIGDRIVAVDGRKVGSADDLLHLFESAGVGAEVTLTVERDGRSREVKVKLIPLD